MQQKFPRMMGNAAGKGEPVWNSRTGDRFGWCEWRPQGVERALVVALHGLNLRATDFTPLGEALAPAGIRTAAWNLRGQGLDPEVRRRGAWLKPDQHAEDLADFIDFAQRGRPAVPVFVCGDSMGALLALHAATQNRSAGQFAGVLLLVPVVNLAQKNPPWVRALIRLLARTVPSLRLNPGWFVHGKASLPLLTRIPERQLAVETAPHRVGALTVEFLAAMGELIDSSDRLASNLGRPVAVFSAGHDCFVSPQQTSAFFERITSPDRTYFQYPGAYHQLLFDLDRDRVLVDFRGWVDARITTRR